MDSKYGVEYVKEEKNLIKVMIQLLWEYWETAFMPVSMGGRENNATYFQYIMK